MQESRHISLWIYGGLAVTALAVLILGGWGLFQLWQGHTGMSFRNKAILNLGIADHVNCVMGARIAETTFSPENMALALGPDYIGLVSLLERTLPSDFHIPVAHQCSVNGRRFIHLVIKDQKKILSLIVTRKDGSSFVASTRGDATDVVGMPLYQARLENLEVAGFETRDHFGFVVSALDRKENLQIASELASPVREFLRKLEF
jgi:hypothetical protein